LQLRGRRRPRRSAHAERSPRNHVDGGPPSRRLHHRPSLPPRLGRPPLSSTAVPLSASSPRCQHRRSSSAALRRASSRLLVARSVVVAFLAPMNRAARRPPSLLAASCHASLSASRSPRSRYWHARGLAVWHLGSVQVTGLRRALPAEHSSRSPTP